MIMGFSPMGGVLTAPAMGREEAVTEVLFSNGIFDTLYGTGLDERVKPVDQILPPDAWDEATHFHARFSGNIYCGNADFGVDNTTNILVKRRKKGEFQWFTLFDIPAAKAEDYTFTVHDPYAPKGDLEYAVVPIINGFESEYSITGIHYDFQGLLLIEKERSVQTILNIAVSEQKNGPVGILSTLEGKYPFVFYNGENDYYSGTISATFIETDTHKDFRMDRLHDHYREVLDFLNNKNPKILKLEDGRMRIISITTPPSDSCEEHPDKHTISFGYTEIADALSNEDMNRCGFLDVGEEWWVK